MKFAACQSDNVITTTLMHTHTPLSSLTLAREEGKTIPFVPQTNETRANERKERFDRYAKYGYFPPRFRSTSSPNLSTFSLPRRNENSSGLNSKNVSSRPDRFQPSKRYVK